MTPQSEYRPTEYMQAWMQFWFDAEKRLTVAQQFQHTRMNFIQTIWNKDRELKAHGISAEEPSIRKAIERCRDRTDHAVNVGNLLQAEAELTKKFYRYIATTVGYGDFTRQRDGQDLANSFLNHGNYLAYGLAATTLWVLGIPHGFAVMHGKTRRGALVFDVADIIKDALVLPWAFICAKENATEQEFRQQCLQAFTDHDALGVMFEEVKRAALTNGFEPNKAEVSGL